jgi:hypothetical protein
VRDDGIWQRAATGYDGARRKVGVVRREDRVVRQEDRVVRQEDRVAYV